MRGDFGDLIGRIRAHNGDAKAGCIVYGHKEPFYRPRWGVLATRHTLYVAHLVADRLQAHGWEVEILTEAPRDFHRDCYVTICPQMFRRLPPGEKRIAFQMEQSVSPRWFTNRYLKTLKRSLAVLEYSLVNVDFLAGKGVAYPQVHYLPVGASVNFGQPTCSSEKTFDILFYGDSAGCPRRREMLDALQQHFDVRVVSEVFGRDVREIIKQARLVINLHYYNNALLEMPRIQECLTLGVQVLSESSQDQEDYPELKGAVRFFEQGSIPAMLAAVEAALEAPVPAEKIAAAVERSARRFEFMFDRALVALGFLLPSHVNRMNLPLPPSPAPGDFFTGDDRSAACFRRATA